MSGESGQTGESDGLFESAGTRVARSRCRGRNGGNCTARKVALLAIILAVSLASAVGAQSTAKFVASTTRTANAAVLKILLGRDTTDAVAAAGALGRRKDAYVGDILSGLFARVTGTESYRATLLLRIVIEYDFLLPTPRPARIAANASELTDLLEKLQSIPDAETKGALLEVSRYLAAGASEKPLLDEGSYLSSYLRSSGGQFAPDRRDEAVAFIGACRAHSNFVLRSQVVRLVELARDATFVRAARSYLAETG